MRNRLDWGEAVCFVGATALLFLSCHFGADAGGAVLAEAAGVNGRRGYFFLGLGWGSGELSSKVDLHLLRVGLDVWVPVVALWAADAVGWMAAGMR